MSSKRSAFGDMDSRRRRAHTKSRHGCRNCKLRRIKCDEQQPQCQKCASFGVLCNYSSAQGSDLQPAWQEAQMKTNEPSFKQAVFSFKPQILELSNFSVITVGSGYSSFTMDQESLARLNRFQTRTVYSFGTKSALNIYQNDVVQLALEHPFLMHVILAVTAIHDRHLLPAPKNGTRSLTEIYHGAQGAALLAEKLSRPIAYADRDALWSTAAMIGVATMTSIEASNPMEAWPMKPFESTDLGWLSLTKGKEAVWRATNPLRPDSIFYRMADDYRAHRNPPRLREIADIPYDFVHLCSLDGRTPLEQNPYYTAVSLLADFIELESSSRSTEESLPRFVSFLGIMTSDFRSLLYSKDPRALLLFAYWYSFVDASRWWIARRAWIECQSICFYLDRYHASDSKIQALLERPKRRCGLMD
ncbi:uncharacterized protein N7483_003581 [Penicillium malachiteum]|uniref:uncharacterized protein n=1 Tax=Penicillium malachiteum TaxID=1324776 RepID=UPI0025465D41|nr:uncharacterized protein N7483_003581 [Penicillium malachiteum]KAJ5729073.1 hypothetical protein N7483_003581 [Penicillium malachiteum]